VKYNLKQKETPKIIVLKQNIIEDNSLMSHKKLFNIITENTNEYEGNSYILSLYLVIQF